MKLWDKNIVLDKRIERFTVGMDHQLDQRLVAYDCIASKAHARMLCSIGVLTQEEFDSLEHGLDGILELNAKGEFVISVEDEDCHTAIENHLVAKCGAAGKKIHTGRSRNDQVLTALRLYEKDSLRGVESLLQQYQRALARLAQRYATLEMPGYSHMQRAMPTNASDWLGCFVAASIDDTRLIHNALELIDQCPLGTAAGFGVPVLKLDRQMTAAELGFATVMENPLYAQMSRGKFESVIIDVCSQIMFDLNKLATDLALFSTKEYGFVDLPARICTGSSIMPQKKNPDVLELIRAKYHVVVAEETKVRSIIGNLPSGYNRDVQLTKEPLFTAIDTTAACLEIMKLILDELHIDKEACAKALTEEIYATEKAYQLVAKGIPFRQAYRHTAQTILADIQNSS